MSGKPTAFPMPTDVLNTLPTQAQDHLPPATFGATAPTLAAGHATGPGEHFAPHATVDLPDAAADGIGHASLPSFVSDWLL